MERQPKQLQMFDTRPERKTIREALPDDCLPEKRAAMLGVMALSDIELLQLICPRQYADSAAELLKAAGGLAGLVQMHTAEIAAFPGIGEKGALAIKAALEVGRRLVTQAAENKPQVRSPEDLFSLLFDLTTADQEHLVVLLFDARHQVVERVNVYKGSVNMAQVRIAEVFKDAIRRNAAAIAVAHNHPSGDPSPSPEDVALTREIVQAGRLLSIDVLDHIVIGQNRYVSLRERGLGFDK